MKDFIRLSIATAWLLLGTGYLAWVCPPPKPQPKAYDLEYQIVTDIATGRQYIAVYNRREPGIAITPRLPAETPPASDQAK